MILDLREKYNISSFIYNKINFPDGQQNIEIIDNELKTDKFKEIEIISNLNNFLDLELIICANQSLKELGYKNISLFIPYFLGGRSDRKFKEGGNNYIKDVISPIINLQNFNSVTVLDPHSDVIEACINNIKIKGIDSYINNVINSINNEIVLVSPDAGALKKVYKIREKYKIKNLLIGSKNRDVNGKITHTSISGDVDSNIKDFLIVDDICDGGRTFIELAKVIKEKYKNAIIHLYVTHGIFSQGIEVLYEHIDFIYTTNSIKEIERVENFTQFKSY